MGAIAITSDSPDAKIFLDGSDTGQITPAILATVAVGSRALRLELASYGKWEGSVVVVESQTANVSAALAPYVYAFVAKWGSSGTGDGQFNEAVGIAEDALGFIYISDYRNQRIQKFRLTTAIAVAAAKIIYSPLPARGGKRAAQAAPSTPASSREAIPGTESKTPPAGKKERTS